MDLTAARGALEKRVPNSVTVRTAAESARATFAHIFVRATTAAKGARVPNAHLVVRASIAAKGARVTNAHLVVKASIAALAVSTHLERIARAKIIQFQRLRWA